MIIYYTTYLYTYVDLKGCEFGREIGLDYCTDNMTGEGPLSCLYYDFTIFKEITYVKCEDLTPSPLRQSGE